jgi:hypothetical protein
MVPSSFSIHDGIQIEGESQSPQRRTFGLSAFETWASGRRLRQQAALICIY